MKKGWKILIGIVVVLVLVIAGAWFHFTRDPFPKTKGKLKLAGLQAPVEIVRDEMGTPHIYASNVHDLFMAEGFVHAQDRFWQMEFWRRIGAGRLSEILGKSALDTDRFIRTVGWRRDAEKDWDVLSPEAKAAMQAYAEGVNAYLKSHKGSYGLEFTILKLTGVDFKPDPWTPLDSLTWGKVMAWDLGGNMEMELERARLATTVDKARRKAASPAYPLDHPTIVSIGLPEDVHAHNDLLSVVEGIPSVFGGSGLGSNNWVIAGSRTTTGKPFLANDPHLGIRMPSIWYEIGLHCQPVTADCPYDVVGVSFPTAPGVIIGHNARIAWGVTNVDPDVQDLYVEKLNPDDPYQYEVDGHWERMKVIHETIKVKGRDHPVEMNVRLTRHGPIINDAVTGPESPWAYGWQPLALRWTASSANRALDSVLEIDRAQNWDQFRQALKKWDAPSQNFVYADVDGNIGYQMPGKVPIRAKGDGTVPVPGWTDEYEWKGYIPFEELPHVFNPKKGYIVTANNAVVGPGYKYLLTKDWDYGYRAKRIVEMIEAKKKISRDYIQQMQMDAKNESAAEILPYLEKLTFDDPELEKAKQRLASWNLQETADSPEAALYEVFWWRLISNTFRDELPKEMWPYGGDRTKIIVREILKDPNNPWWDDVDTDPVETRDEILAKSFREAYRWCQKKMGKSMDKWKWGKLHTATFRNQSLGKSGVAPIEMIFNRGPVPVGGSTDLVDATSYNMAKDSFKVVWIPSMRMIIDLSDLSNSLLVHTTGESGHPYNKHYDDMIPLWQKGKNIPLLWTRKDVDAHAKARLKLIPKK